MFRYIVVFILLGLVSGCKQASSVLLKGDLIVEGTWTLSEGEPCEISNVKNIMKGKNYKLNEAIKQNLKVTVKNPKNEIIAIGKLGYARTVENASSHMNCAFPIIVGNVPTSDFYTISIGDIEKNIDRKDIEQDKVHINVEHDALVKLVPQ